MKRKTDSTDTEMTKTIGLGDRLDRRSEGYRREWPELVNK